MVRTWIYDPQARAGARRSAAFASFAVSCSWGPRSPRAARRRGGRHHPQDPLRGGRRRHRQAPRPPVRPRSARPLARVDRRHVGAWLPRGALTISRKPMSGPQALRGRGSAWSPSPTPAASSPPPMPASSSPWWQKNGVDLATRFRPLPARPRSAPASAGRTSSSPPTPAPTGWRRPQTRCRRRRERLAPRRADPGFLFVGEGAERAAARASAGPARGARQRPLPRRRRPRGHARGVRHRRRLPRPAAARPSSSLRYLAPSKIFEIAAMRAAHHPLGRRRGTNPSSRRPRAAAATSSPEDVDAMAQAIEEGSPMTTPTAAADGPPRPRAFVLRGPRQFAPRSRLPRYEEILREVVEARGRKSCLGAQVAALRAQMSGTRGSKSRHYGPCMAALQGLDRGTRGPSPGTTAPNRRHSGPKWPALATQIAGTPGPGVAALAVQIAWAPAGQDGRHSQGHVEIAICTRGPSGGNTRQSVIAALGARVAALAVQIAALRGPSGRHSRSR